MNQQTIGDNASAGVCPLDYFTDSGDSPAPAARVAHCPSCGWSGPARQACPMCGKQLHPRRCPGCGD
jgi:hypothetical protein